MVPTSGRAGYLEVTLDSLRGQRTRHSARAARGRRRLHGRDPRGGRQIRRAGRPARRAAQPERRPQHRPARGARRADRVRGRRRATCRRAGSTRSWRGPRRHPDAEAFGGPIRPRFEGHAPRSCGREDPPITTLDLGAEDREAEMVWGANFAVRRSAVDRIGEFDESFDRGHGDEEDWLHAAARRGRADRLSGRRGTRPPPRGGRLRPRLARARRVPPRPRARGRATGVTARRRRVARELRDAGGRGWHTVRRACPQG